MGFGWVGGECEFFCVDEGGLGDLLITQGDCDEGLFGRSRGGLDGGVGKDLDDGFVGSNGTSRMTRHFLNMSVSPLDSTRGRLRR